MIRVSRVSAPSDQQLNRLIRRVALLLAVGAIAFAGFYLVDRFRLPQPTIVNREMAALEEAVRIAPEDVAARGRLADAYTGVGRYEEAIVQYDAILETGKADKPALLGRAKANRALGNFAPAISDYERVVELSSGGEMAVIDTGLQAAYFGLGAIALDEGRPADAIEQLGLALDINRADADALHLIGRAYTANGELDKAIVALRRAVAFVPIGWPEPYAALADAYAAQGDDPRATWATGMAALAAGDAPAARAALEPIADGPAALDASIGLALVAETEGDLATAAQWYRAALAIDPDNAEARLGLGRAAEPPPAASPLPTLPNPGQVGGDGS